jgi:methylthioxylose transferase
VTEQVRQVTNRLARWWVPGIAAAAVVVAVRVVWGWHEQAMPKVKLGAAPLVGRWDIRFGWSLLPAALLAGCVARFGQRLAQGLQFARLTLIASASATVFTLLLAASDGWGHVLDPVVHPSEYWANLATLPPTHEMLRRYDTIEFLGDYSVHARGHPPGFLLILKGLEAIGIGHPWVVGALSYLGVAVLVAASLATIRLLAGERSARAVAPYLVVVPYSVWMGTSADAFYAGVAAVVVLLVVVALVASRSATRRVGAVGAGVLLGALLMLTYGGVVFGLLPMVVAVGVARTRRCYRPLAEVCALTGAGLAAVLLAFRLAGFWWFDGLHVTRTFYWWGTAPFRRPAYFALANIAVTLIAIGPAVVVAISRLSDRRIWLMVGAAMACIVAADVSQYSRGEVERIWLLFFPWLLPATATLEHPRRWLALQGVLAVGLQLTLASKW